MPLIRIPFLAELVVPLIIGMGVAIIIEHGHATRMIVKDRFVHKAISLPDSVSYKNTETDICLPFRSIYSKSAFSLCLSLAKKCNLINSLSVNPTKWSNALKQFVGNFRRIDRVYFTIL